MDTKQYDLIVIGGGPGGYVAAIRAAQLGLDVACIEKEPVLGGTCLRIGCIPSKALLESSEHYHEALSGLNEHGISVGDVKLDLAAMHARKDRIVGELTQGIDMLFKKNKITRYLGTGRFTGPKTVAVDGGEPVELTAQNIIIATGSRPATLKGVELDGEYIGDSTTALNYPEVPKHLAVIGAGVIGLELGSVWRRLGAQVTVLEYMDQILPGLDSEIVREAHRMFKKQGFTFHLGARVTAARREGDGCIVEAEGLEPVRCDRVLLVVGRWPNTDGLMLDAAGLATDERGFIPVDGHSMTEVDGVYAIGDVTRGLMLAHRAEEEGIATAEWIVQGHSHINYDAIPGVVYTQPEIASVGKTEDELKAAGVEYNKGVFMFRANGRAKAMAQTDGRVKVLADKQTDRVLGVHIIGPAAGELLAECVMAMEFGGTSLDIAKACHSHPTLSEVVKEAALDVHGRAIHS